MADKFVGMTPEDAAELKRMYEAVKKLLNHEDSDIGPDNLQSSADIFMAYSPAPGIPALTPGSGPTDDTPGSAMCDLYRMNLDTGKMVLMGSKQRKVFNFSFSAVTGNRWIVINKTKQGIYVVVFESC